MKRGACWFSAGITSTVATKIALEECEGKAQIDIYFFETGNHHPDNERYIKECEEWFGQKIEIVRNPKWNSVEHVLSKQRYINGPAGAPCTSRLKKDCRFELEKKINFDFQIFGFEYEKKEINRAVRFMEQYPETNAVFPLIERKIDKKKAVEIVKGAGIEIPMMYRLGYTNNNCVGCVKGGMGYWNKIREDFPDVFQRFSDLEQEIGASCLKDKDEHGNTQKLFLKDLDPSRGRKEKPITAECGVICAVEFADIISDDVERYMKGDKVFATLQDKIAS